MSLKYKIKSDNTTFATIPPPPECLKKCAQAKTKPDKTVIWCKFESKADPEGNKPFPVSEAQWGEWVKRNLIEKAE